MLRKINWWWWWYLWSFRRSIHRNRRKLPSTSFDPPLWGWGTSANIRICLVFSGTGYTFLPLVVWVYLHSNFCSGLQNTHLFCTRVRIGRSRSSKVDNFGTNRKRVCELLLVRHCDYIYIYSCLAPFLRYAIYWLKIAYFSYPSLIWRPRFLCSLRNFAV